MEKIKVFTSYAHEDEEDKNILSDLLNGLITNGSIEEWNDRYIIPGEEWDKEIKKKLHESQIVLFLLSKHFLKSDYIRDVEIKNTLDKYKKGEVVIISIILSKCNFAKTSLNKFQALPKDAKPIDMWGKPTKGWLDVIEGIKRAVEKEKGIKNDTQPFSGGPTITIRQSGNNNFNVGINKGTINFKIKDSDQ